MTSTILPTSTMKNLSSAPPSECGLFDEIRAGFAFVAGAARDVAIDVAALDSYAAALPGKMDSAETFDSTHHYTGKTEEDTAAYVLALDAINFGSGYKPALKEEGWIPIDGSIYYGVSTRLKHRFESASPMTARDMEELDARACAAILALDPGKPASGAFAARCAAALRELGAAVCKNADGSFAAFTGQAGGSAEELVRALSRLESFRDVSQYDGREIPFYKRAQIAAADLHLAFARHGRALFGDIDRLTMFADNGVPHVLRVDGILKYTPGLAARIDEGREIPAGSPEEVEIRACAGHAVEMIAARRGLCAMDADHILWHRSTQDRYRQTRPHLTRTVFY